MLCLLPHVPRSYVARITTMSCIARLDSKCIHSHEIGVTAERVQKQQHQVKDEAVLLLLEDETMDSSCNYTCLVISLVLQFAIPSSHMQTCKG